MTNTPLNPEDEERLEKALEQSANGQVVSRGSFAQYAQTPLNKNALEASSREIFPSLWELIDLHPDDPNTPKYMEYALSKAEAAIRAYLAVAQPVLTTQEELDSMPHETVIRDSQDFVFEGIVQHGMDLEWWCTTEFLNELNETKVTLPARVLYLPEVKHC